MAQNKPAKNVSSKDRESPQTSCKLNLKATTANARTLADLLGKHYLEDLRQGEKVCIRALGYRIIVRMQRKERNTDWLQSCPRLKLFDIRICKTNKTLEELIAVLYHEFGHIAINIEKIKKQEVCGTEDYESEVAAWALALNMMEHNGINVERCLPEIKKALFTYAGEEYRRVATGPALVLLGKWSQTFADYIRKRWSKRKR